MRKALVVAVVAGLVGVAGSVRDASAGATVDLVFIGQNGAAISPTDTVTAAAGDTLTIAVLLRNDQALTTAIFSLNYDLDGDDELDVVSAFAWQGFPFFVPPPLLPPTPTFIGPFGGSSILTPPIRPLPPAGGAFAGGYQVGTVVWKVNAGVNDDGADIIPGLFNPGVPGPFFADAAFNEIGGFVLFRSATVNIPEPGTASLLGLGLVALLLAGRRSRASRRR